MKRKLMMLLTLFFVGIGIIIAQTQVRGVVVDETGEPVIGATVQVKGSSLGTVTDMDGNFNLSVSSGGRTLVISYVGMQTQEVPASANVRVVLAPDAALLDELVVTALGISRERKSLGSAVQNVKSDELIKAAPSNVISSLSGKIAGMQVNQAGGQIGASSRIVLRGNSSLGNNQPLIVIDGIPVSNSSIRDNDIDYGSGLNDVNPQDIESVTVLKGGSAAALYGMRAGHGVILITTKTGAGRNKGVEIDYDANFNVDNVYRIQRMQNKYGQGYYGDEYNYKLAQQDGYTGSYQDYALGGYDDGMGFSYADSFSGVNDGVDESWGPRLDAGLMIPQYNSPIVDGVRVATPWVSHPSNMKDLFQTGYSTSHNLSLTSRTDNSTTRLSLGYRDQKGVLPNTDLKRYNVGVNSTMSLLKMVEANMVVNYSRTESDNLPVTEYNASNPMQSMGQWFGRQVDIKDLKANWKKTLDNGYPYNWNSNYHNNPFWSLNKNTNAYQKNRVFGKMSLFITPTEYLKFEGRLGLDYFDSMSNPVITYGSNETNLGTGTGEWHGGWFRLNNQKNTEWNADFIAYFNKSFDDLSVNAFAGANYRDYRWRSSSVGANELTVPDLFTISNVKGSPVTSMDNIWIRTNSIYASLSLGYKDFAYLDGTLRKDWSSTLRTPFSYPSVSASILPLAALDIDSDLFTFLKVRGGWSQVGSATDSYAIDPYFSASASTIFGVTQYSQATIFPPASLEPEKVETAEIGLEANMFKGRLGLDVALYNKTTTNQILEVTVSKATGYNAMLVNAGKFKNKGIELQLTGVPVRTSSGFEWNVTLNWAKDKSKIVELYVDPVTGEPLESYRIGAQWSTQVQARPGEAWGEIYGTGSLRRESDGAIIVNADGVPRTQGNQRLGNVTPDWLGGIRNEFSYKNVSAGFLLDIRKGGDIFSISNMFGAYSGVLEYTAWGDFRENGLVLGKDFMKGQKFVKVVTPNAEDIQKSEFAENDIVAGAQDFFESYYSNREFSVYDGSYIKLREAHITYQLPKSLFGSSNFVKSASVSLVGTNLAILWTHKSNMSKLDPENTVTSENSGVGLETTSFPPSRSVGIKLNLKF